MTEGCASTDGGASTVAARKDDLRRAARAARDRLSPAVRHAAADALVEKLLKIPLPSGAVAGYWPLGAEIDPRPALLALGRLGRDLALPVTGAARTPLTFRRWRSEDPVIQGRFGTLTPPESAPEIRPAVLLMPLLAFDRHGNRLGYGGGYYDRTLARLSAEGRVLAVGVAYGIQEVSVVPTGPFDRPLDLLVTETEVIFPADGKNR